MGKERGAGKNKGKEGGTFSKERNRQKIRWDIDPR